MALVDALNTEGNTLNKLALLQSKLERAGFDRVAQELGYSVFYLQKMVKGHNPISRRVCDGLDRISGQTTGKTWVELQEAKS